MPVINRELLGENQAICFRIFVLVLAVVTSFTYEINSIYGSVSLFVMNLFICQ